MSKQCNGFGMQGGVGLGECPQEGCFLLCTEKTLLLLDVVTMVMSMLV